MDQTAETIKAQQSASRKAAKPAAAKPAAKPAKISTVPAHLTKGGKVGQCQVLTSKGQCSNPSRHPLLGGFTCTTHGKRVAAGKVYKMVKADKAYDPTLWGGPVTATAKS